ncbi:CPBP family intramembrane metalloprotease [Enterococcus sp. BWT-B8]|uniref:CPBP family intramembrane glutamic endopeptidase n=1 Tax=Enterococcus sp. BWT-B8 TaxID=2885157 RepID=UPI001E486D53|nr:CPBP family intramembrane glutamic endopeptidase [Enterococcus sp. BWT-B8]MCB5953213.1 CPBP family intramembrane metalloprotease [Enterococcus sp. BWT-B8]
MNKIYLKLLSFSLGLTIIISLFSAASMVLKIDDNGIIIFQIAAFLSLAILLFFYMKKKDSTLEQFGFEKTYISKSILSFIALIILIQPIILGINFSLPFSTLLLIIIQMILVGFVEESLFRGIFFYFLKDKQPKVYLLFSSIVFGLLHVASGLNPETAPLLVFLQIINALLSGAVFAILYYSLKSIYLVITFHTLFNIFASVTLEGSFQLNLVAVSILTICYIIFLIYYTKIVFFLKK